MGKVAPKNVAAAGGLLALALAGLLLTTTAGVEPPPVMGEVPAYALTDADGKEFSSAAIEGPYVASFIFTRCASQCPMVTTQMQGLHQKVPGLQLVSFSVDPKDTPEKLKKYAKSFDADWTFLSGGPGVVADLVEFGFRLSPGRENLLNHSKRLVLVDGARRIRGYYESAEPADLERLAQHARLVR